LLKLAGKPGGKPLPSWVIDEPLEKQHGMIRPHKAEARAAAWETAHFFDEVEQMIVQRLHREASSDEGREKLVRSTGVNDPHLIGELIRLGVTADGLVAMRFVPLVLVAWAEGNVDASERELVMKEAKKLGILENSEAWVLLNTWLRRMPRGITVDAWKRYLRGSFAAMSPAAREKWIHFTELEMHAIAQASGGLLGFGTVSKKERFMMRRLTSVMHELSAAASVAEREQPGNSSDEK